MLIPTPCAAVIDVAGFDDLEDGRLRLVRAGEARVALCRRGDAVHAVGAVCSHARIFLAPGRLDRDGLIECPMHGAKFSPEDGTVRCPPATEPLPVYATRIEAGRVLVAPEPNAAAAPPAASNPWAKWSQQGN